MKRKRGQKSRLVCAKTGKKHGKRTGRKKRRQTGVFLSRYDFVYTDRDTVNQVGKIAPEVMKQAAGQIEKIAQDRINQVIRSSGAGIERVLPKKIYAELWKTFTRHHSDC